jgi:hypothetical protein
MDLPKQLVACWSNFVLTLPQQQWMGLPKLVGCGTGFKQRRHPRLWFFKQYRCRLFSCRPCVFVSGANPFIIVTAPLLD